MQEFRNNPPAFSALLRPLIVLVFLCHLLVTFLQGNAQAAEGPVIASRRQPFQSVQDMRDLVRKIYSSQIGVRETQSNSGSAVEKYLRYVNLDAGSPWCAAFVCWVLGSAGVENPRSGWSPELFRTGKVIWEAGESNIKYQVSRFPQNAREDQGTKIKEQRFPQNAREDQGTKIKEQGRPQNALGAYFGAQAGILVRPARQLIAGNRKQVTPRSADIFGLFFSEKGRIAHVGFIDEWGDTWVTTVEGNTNVPGSREGDGVYRKRRLVRSVYKVARYVN